MTNREQQEGNGQFAIAIGVLRTRCYLPVKPKLMRRRECNNMFNMHITVFVHLEDKKTSKIVAYRCFAP